MRSVFIMLLLMSFQLLAQNYGYDKEELVAVGINGAKVNPGTYRVSPDQRVLDVIKMANEGALPPLDTIDCRNIILVNEDGSADTLDLLRFLNTGDLAENPYVAGGQSIHIDFATEWVYISGDVQGVLVGDVPLKRGETAAELLSLYTPNATADLKNILFERVGESPTELSFMHLDTVQIKNQDGITIFPFKERKDVYRVTVSGEVKRPGIYSIEHGKTMANSLIERSGGATALGDIGESWLVRKGKRNRLPEEELSEGMQSVKKEVTFSASNGVISGDFLIIPLKDGDSKLEDGDEIIVPKKERLVYISGFVKNPGGYPYTEKMDIDYYINKAGGFSAEADKRAIRVVETYGDVYRTVENEMITAGDVIFVPEKDKERRTRFVLGIVTSVASVMTSIVTLATFIDKTN